MCGIVGFLAKSDSMESRLGELITPMFACMADRGPDSGGCAFFSRPTEDAPMRFNLYAPSRDYNWSATESSLRECCNRDSGELLQFAAIENHGRISCQLSPEVFQHWLMSAQPDLKLLSFGRRMDVYKDQGHPAEIARRYRFTEAKGTHCVAHTRMATESAVTPAHSHPFTGGEDFCLVHNGSLSNPYMLRRKLEQQGLTFETDNDTEAACRFLQWRMQEGDGLEAALLEAFSKLDGFYTLLMATSDQLCLVRDAFACKPAVVAETDDYVAISSEFRSLAHLPGIDSANIFEPKPEEIYLWKV